MENKSSKMESKNWRAAMWLIASFSYREFEILYLKLNNKDYKSVTEHYPMEDEEVSLYTNNCLFKTNENIIDKKLDLKTNEKNITAHLTNVLNHCILKELEANIEIIDSASCYMYLSTLLDEIRFRRSFKSWNENLSYYDITREDTLEEYYQSIYAKIKKLNNQHPEHIHPLTKKDIQLIEILVKCTTKFITHLESVVYELRNENLKFKTTNNEIVSYELGKLNKMESLSEEKDELILAPTIIQKVLLMSELGIFEHLNSRYTLNNNLAKMAAIAAVFTDIEKDSIRKAIEGIKNKTKNSPSDKNYAWLSETLVKLGIKK